MRAYAEEMNRLNRERRASGDAWRAELAKVEKQIQVMIEAVKEGMFQRAMIAAMDSLEARKAELSAQLAEAPADTPDMLLNASHLYANKISHLTEALNRPEDRAEAAQTLRGLIERIVVRPGAKRGQIDATLHGELGDHSELDCSPAKGQISRNENSRSRGHGSSDTLGCGDVQPLPA
jgi:site-specific DNA recombinase